MLSFTQFGSGPVVMMRYGCGLIVRFGQDYHGLVRVGAFCCGWATMHPCRKRGGKLQIEDEDSRYGIGTSTAFQETRTIRVGWLTGGLSRPPVHHSDFTGDFCDLTRPYTRPGGRVTRPLQTDREIFAFKRCKKAEKEKFLPPQRVFED